jgi:hypothetical protein
VSLKYSDQEKRDSIYNKHAARSYEEHARAMETYLLKLENPGITRDKNGVTIKLLNGKTLKLTPRAVYEDFTFAHFFKTEKLLLFRVLEEMDWSYMLVDLRDGKSTADLMEVPVFSPDKKMFFTFNSEVQSEGINGFQIFSFTDGSIRKIWEYKPEYWGPVEASWVNYETIISRNEQLDGPDVFKKIIIKRVLK